MIFENLTMNLNEKIMSAGTNKIKVFSFGQKYMVYYLYNIKIKI